MRRAIIIGCGRSGTLYTVRLLRSTGLAFGHECLEEAGGCGWQLTLPEWQDQWQKQDVVIHQIRDPWAAIASLTTHDAEVYERAQAIVGPFSDLSDRVRTAAEWWVRHNLYCAELAEWTHRTRDLVRGSIATRRLFDVVCGPGRPVWPPRNTNTREHDPIGPADLAEWPDLLAQVNDAAERFGYERRTR